MPTLLVTGAAGIVGTALRPFLRQRYSLRLLPIDACSAACGSMICACVTARTESPKREALWKKRHFSQRTGVFRTNYGIV